MTTEQAAIKNLSATLIEQLRLRALPNEDLVREYLKLSSDQDDELHVNEMMTRLWPEWETVEL